jgi:hypothetical protein
MAITKKERTFSKIMDDVEFTEIPIIFIKRLTIVSTEDKVFSLNNEELKAFPSIEDAIRSFPHEVYDIKIELDMKLIEETVEKEKNRLLGENGNKDND